MKTILLGVSDGISTYKAVDIISQLARPGYNVEILMTKSSAALITPLTLQSLSKSPVCTGVMTEVDPSKINHIGLAEKAGLFLVVPVSTNTVEKLTHGVADDLLSTIALVLCPETPKIIASAVNTYIYQNPTAQQNIGILKEIGHQGIIPREALLAYGDHDRSTLATVENILQAVMKALTSDNRE